MSQEPRAFSLTMALTAGALASLTSLGMVYLFIPEIVAEAAGLVHDAAGLLLPRSAGQAAGRTTAPAPPAPPPAPPPRRRRATPGGPRAPDLVDAAAGGPGRIANDGDDLRPGRERPGGPDRDGRRHRHARAIAARDLGPLRGHRVRPGRHLL